ncbi:MAG: polyhydroxyalkanoic acid system family protein [Pirellulales bacterium]
MPSLQLSVPHKLGINAARAALQGFFTQNSGEMAKHATDVVQNWTGNLLSFAFKAMGMAVSGTLEVHETDVKIDAKLPLAASLFKGKIESELRQNLVKILEYKDNEGLGGTV